MNGERLPSILFVDDDEDALFSLIRAVRALCPSVSLHGAATVASGLSLAKAKRPHVAIIDLWLDEKSGVESGFSLLRELQKSDPACRVIVLTGHQRDDYGIQCLRQGAASFLNKPVSVEHLVALIRDGIRQCDLMRAYEALRVEQQSKVLTDLIVGKSASAARLREAVAFAASTEQPVLITGETGTGKGLCAAAIHQFSNRARGPFIRCQPNLGSPDLANSELFGYRQGAFTGASSDRIGLVQAADAGTLFLDEVDQLPEPAQVALLGVLQDRTYRPLGTVEEVRVDFRLLCATNEDSALLIERGALRADFFHRIAYEHLEIPPLRDRKEDIEELCQHQLRGMQDQASVFEIAPSAIELLTSHDWPGNVRELQAVISSAACRARFERRSRIDPADIRFFERSKPPAPGVVPALGGGGSLDSQVEQFKLQVIKQTLEQVNGNRTEAAAKLAIDRSTLHRILQRNLTSVLSHSPHRSARKRA